MMRSIKLFLFIALFGFFVIPSFGQTCTHTLRLAQSTYEQGRLHEVPTILNKCLKNNGFTETELVNAYKILINSYIYLEEPKKADSTMLKLLEADHFFKINEAVDPAEFISLYKTFRTTPLFRFGLKVGPTATMPALSTVYSGSSDALGNGNFTPKVNLSLGVVFEKDFFGFIKNFSIAPEIVYVIRSYNYVNTRFNVSDENPDVAVNRQDENLQKQQWFDLNLLGQYRLKDNKFQPYVSVGPGISYILSSTNELSTKVGDAAITGPKENTKSSYNNLAYSAIFSFGSKIRLGGFYFTGDIRYQLGLNNVVNKSQRSNDEVLFNYGYVPSDYRHNNFTVNLGFVIPHFNPIKLTK